MKDYIDFIINFQEQLRHGRNMEGSTEHEGKCENGELSDNERNKNC